ncbi:AraC family transcriptional regulator [Reichenbachiella agarivorans]|uniref:AraC family transcriptional regulator n=1 Tax=Reichenbachiella agarivorans TaxID=2979464 RepID=A0ABY6CNE7_9BACT|nr:AraC family transcriptional regulator [Reichenbachiella agarivorans]UXP32031.1 AraC family transcriptional regulator [Reichenbachiella agarivorans]
MYKTLQSLRLSLLNAGYASLDRRWNYDHVISPFSRMYYVDQGEGYIYHHDQQWQLKPGHMYLIPSFTYSRYRCPDSMGQYYLSFLEEVGEGQSIYQINRFVYEVEATDQDLQLIQRYIALNPGRSYVDDNPKVYDNQPVLMSFLQKNEQLSASVILESRGILLSLFSRFILNENYESSKGSQTHELVARSARYIDQHLPDLLNVELLADQCHLHVDYYSKIFVEVFGQRPIQYIQQKRIQRAQLLLTTTNYSLIEISHRVGLPNLSYFSRLFSKITGTSPARYRKDIWRH